ncbi:hypothetical protein U14_04954 [Candidatus Moduliflexus flocculans]|uniref:Outer membrane lipoprotein BamD-like domain-containing protein n=1 Tax=Candidatus Moduliflexus flocculans TaxID=1499966 RepID=A0A081BQK2_9BACT|nr:hypothetical protein U14_04954 [Candidatus Moduliflexus flocculans]
MLAILRCGGENVKTCNMFRRAIYGGFVGMALWLSSCASPQQEQSLTQIQSQISVLSNEMRDSFSKTEEDTVNLYKQLNEEVRQLQKNQADNAEVNDQLAASVTAIEAKLDEYNARMTQLSERLDSTETALTDRITSLSDQMGEIKNETAIIPGGPDQQQSAPITEEQSSTTVGSPQDSEASRMYHQPYTLYVNGDFEAAISGFQRYLQQYPGAELADMAQFWIAESFFSLGEYETALKEYDTLINKYPNSDKIPDAFLGKADTFLKLDRQIEAISHLKYVMNQFPDSAAARKAADRLKSLGE